MKQIQQYTTQGEIGRGGTATVYLAHDPSLGQPVAVKLMHEKLQDNGRARQRFEQEARMVAALNHPAIVPVLDFGEMDGRLFIVMPYMAGGSLRQRVEAGPLTPDEALAALEPVASALDAMHHQNIIHRDVKPHNILLDENGRAYLSDFGVARLVNPDGEEHTVTFTGTPEFVAPEQVTDGILGPRTDVYQLGVTLFYLLTARRPFSGTSFNVALQHLNELLPRAEDLNPALPPGCDAIIQRATAKDPQGRYASAGEMVTTLAFIAEGQSETNLFDAALHSRAHGSVVPVAPVARTAVPRRDTAIKSHIPRKKSNRGGRVAAVLGLAAVLLGGLAYGVVSGILPNPVSGVQPDGETNGNVVEDTGSTVVEATGLVEDGDTQADSDTPDSGAADSTATVEVEATTSLEVATPDTADTAANGGDAPPPPPPGGGGGSRRGGGGGGPGGGGGGNGGPGGPPPPGGGG